MVNASSQTTSILINVTEGNDVVTGGTGNDSIFGGNGDDTLNGGDGNDVLFGDAGADVFNGGAGDDFFYIDQSDDRVADAGEGYDRAVLVTSDMSIEVDVTWTGLERIDGTGGAEVIDATGYAEAMVMLGNAGGDSLTGGLGNDVLFGNNGADTLDGGAGGVDQLFGGGNDGAVDVFIFADGSGVDRVRDFEDGFDILDVSEITGVAGIGDLSFSSTATNTMIQAGAEMIVLVNWLDGVDGDLTADDFAFAFA